MKKIFIAVSLLAMAFSSAIAGPVFQYRWLADETFGDPGAGNIKCDNDFEAYFAQFVYISRSSKSNPGIGGSPSYDIAPILDSLKAFQDATNAQSTNHFPQRTKAILRLWNPAAPGSQWTEWEIVSIVPIGTPTVTAYALQVKGSFDVPNVGSFSSGATLSAEIVPIRTRSSAGRIKNSVNQTIPNNVVTPVSFSTVKYDTDGYFPSVPTDAITITRTATMAISAGVKFDTGSVNFEKIKFTVTHSDSSTEDLAPQSAAFSSGLVPQEKATATTFHFVAGDILQVNVTQTSSGGASADIIGGSAFLAIAQCVDP